MAMSIINININKLPTKNDASPGNFNTGTGESDDEPQSLELLLNNSLLSSSKDSDFEFFLNEEKELNSPQNSKVRDSRVYSTCMNSCRYSQYEQQLYSVQVHNNIKMCDEEKSIREGIQMKREITLKVMKEARKPKNLVDLSSNNKKIKVTKMISSLLFYRICYSHMNLKKPTRNALMFNEGMFLPSMKKVRTTCEFTMTTTFPNFQFTVATEDHFEICNDPLNSDEMEDQTLFKKLNKAFLPERIDKKIIQKYRYLKHEIRSFINSIVDELSLDSESVLLSLIYLERLLSKSKMELRASNWKPILITSIILAVKYNEDCCFWNYDFLEFCQYSIPALNLMETRFIQLIDFDIYVSEDCFKRYEKLSSSIYNKTYSFEEKERKKAQYRKYGFVNSKNLRKGSLLK